VVTGDYPFHGDNESHQLSHILFDDLIFPRSMSSELRDLMSKMLEKDASKRITLTDIGSHPWMVQIDETEEICSSFSLPCLPKLRPSLPSISQTQKSRRTNGMNVLNEPKSGLRSQSRLVKCSLPALHQSGVRPRLLNR
jgi:serine/threonine protein kinase